MAPLAVERSGVRREIVREPQVAWSVAPSPRMLTERRAEGAGKEPVRMTHMYGSRDTVRCMKTTVELPEALLREAKRKAAREGTTVRALIEQGLRTVVRGRRPAAQFTLRDAAFRGDGLVAGRSLRDWETIRDLSYSERGA